MNNWKTFGKQRNGSGEAKTRRNVCHTILIVLYYYCTQSILSLTTLDIFDKKKTPKLKKAETREILRSIGVEQGGNDNI